MPDNDPSPERPASPVNQPSVPSDISSMVNSLSPNQAAENQPPEQLWQSGHFYDWQSHRGLTWPIAAQVSQQCVPLLADSIFRKPLGVMHGLIGHLA